MIPKKIHFVWLGNKVIKEEYKNFIDTFKQLYSDYEVKIWNDNDVLSEGIIPDNLRDFYYDNNFSCAFKADILRYLIIYKHGGFYFDVDFQPIRKIQDCFLNFDFLGAIQNNGEVAIGFFAAVEKNELLKNVIDTIPTSIEMAIKNDYFYNEAIHKITGPEFFNNICKKYFPEQDYFFFTKEYFYPYWFDEKHRRNEKFIETSPLCYSVHHWAASWKI